MKIYIKTFEGLEEVLKKEVLDLGLSNVESGKRIVSCEGTLEQVYLLNLGLHTGLRVILPVHEFEANSEDELYNELKKYDWEQYLDVDGYFAINAVTNSEIFSHSKYASYKMKDALVDSFREKYGRRPSVDLETPDVRFNLHIRDNRVTLSLDSSGESLHKRGYRLATNEAPINEVLAAGILKLCSWEASKGLFDPMCGSGTFLIEAACIATQRPPCLFRPEFGFMLWKNFDQEVFMNLKRKLAVEIKPLEDKIVGGEIEPDTIEIARENIAKAKFQNEIIIEQRDFMKDTPPEGIEFVMMNPPYGERLALEQSLEFYQSIGDVFKQLYGGKKAYLITSNLKSVKHLGLRPSFKRTIFNAALECKILGYEMYSGSKKMKFQKK